MNERPKLIGLTGQKRSGKSTAAFALSRYYARLSFAGPLKRMLLAMGLTPEELEDKETVIPRYGKSCRFLMQTLGTEWGRDLISRTHWVDIARHEAKQHLDSGMNVVFDDVRFNNEAEMIRDLGGEIWRIISRPKPTDGHISEAGIDENLVDLQVYNLGTNEEFAQTVRERAGLVEVPV